MRVQIIQTYSLDYILCARRDLIIVLHSCGADDLKCHMWQNQESNRAIFSCFLTGFKTIWLLNMKTLVFYKKICRNLFIYYCILLVILEAQLVEFQYKFDFK